MKFFFNFLKKHREQVVSGTFPSVAEDRIMLSSCYNPQIEMFAHFKTKSSFHKTKRII